MKLYHKSKVEIICKDLIVKSEQKTRFVDDVSREAKRNTLHILVGLCSCLIDLLRLALIMVSAATGC